MRMPTSSPLVFCLALLVAQAAGADAQTLDWAKQAGGPCVGFCGGGFHQGSAIAVDADGNTVVTGRIHGVATFGRGDENETTLTTEGPNLFVAKYDLHGSLLWARQALGDAQGQAIAVDAAGNSYVAGGFRFGVVFPGVTLFGPVSGVGDMFIAKYDAAGNFEWARQGGPDFVPGLPGSAATAPLAPLVTITRQPCAASSAAASRVSGSPVRSCASRSFKKSVRRPAREPWPCSRRIATWGSPTTA